MKFYATILYTFLMVCLGSCVPNYVRYYRPTLEGGNLLTPNCVPTKSIVEFNLPDPNGRLNVRAWADNGKYVNQVSLFFSGNAWETIQFTSTNFQIRDIEKNVIIASSAVLAYTSESTDNLTAESYSVPPGRPGLFRFHVQINTSDPLPENFELISPSIVIDGEEITFPSIRFDKKQWLGISPFNC